MKYRPEIDGLRALAVAPVVLFHARVPGFSGGFLGVDVFFVISGYLITTILANELADGKFSIRRFYERRCRRILPALFVMVIGTLVAGWHLLHPERFKELAELATAVSTFSANLWLWQQVGYFAPAGESNPLLHTWSLAVEEQFYLVFPLLLAGLWRLGRRPTYVAIGVLCAGSFIWMNLLMTRDPDAAFYLPHARAWELLVGTLLYFHKDATLPPRFAGAAAAFGLAAIAASMILPGSMDVPPGLRLALAVSGTALVIQFASPKTIAGRVLSTRALVGLGLISYSLYLWHQPILAYLQVASHHLADPVLRGAGIALSLVVAIASWHFVELPFRQGYSARKIFILAFSGTVLVMSASAPIILSNGSAFRWSPPPSLPASMARDETGCSSGCTIGNGSNPSFVVLGDSHAQALLPAFRQAAEQAGKTGVVYSTVGCAPLLGTMSFPACEDANQRALQYVSEHDIGSIYLVSRWSYYTDGGYHGLDMRYLGIDHRNRKRDKAMSRAAFRVGVAATLEAYQGRRVTMVMQVPEQIDEATSIYWDAYQSHDRNRRLTELSISRQAHEELQSFVRSATESVSNRLDPANVLCGIMKCMVGTLDESFYFDDDHVSVVGAQLLVDLIASDLEL